MSGAGEGDVILSRGDTFLITNPAGDAWDGDHGFYDRDRRVLRRLAVLVDGRPLSPLSGRAIAPDLGQHFAVAPPEVRAAYAGLVVERRQQLREGGLRVRLSVRNYGDADLRLPLTLWLESDFAHVFRVKREVVGESVGEGSGGAGGGALVRLAPQRFEVRSALLGQGAYVYLSQRPERVEEVAGRFDFAFVVPAGGERQITLLVERRGRARVAPRPRTRRAGPRLPEPPLIRARGELGSSFQRAYERALTDLYALAIRGRAIGLAERDGWVAYAAGIPWYIALFGRDALLTSHMTLFVAPELAEGSLRALARLRGRRHDPVTGEDPGKIPHEFRPPLGDGEDDLIPRFPYYGSVDATPLFLVAVDEQVRYQANRRLAHELEAAVLEATAWLDGPGDRDGDGYLEYLREAAPGLVNQGWKDSWDAVHFADGRLAEGPVALVEVQGYLYQARLAAASLLDLYGRGPEAAEQRRRARELRRRFHGDFWLPERRFYALGLDGRKRPIDALTSNGAHVLWSGVAPHVAAAAVARQVFEPHLWSGFGVRTLAAGEGRYNPVSYHNGSVWPHDNVLIAEGLRRYGFTEAAMRIVEALIRATLARPDRRLPELFAGFGVEETPEPVPYPAACPVQAWSAAALPHMVALMLGLGLAAEAVTLAPALPSGLDELEVLGLRLLGEHIDVRLRRDGAGRVRAHVHAPPGFPLPIRRRAALRRRLSAEMPP